MPNNINFFHYKNKLVDVHSFQADNLELQKYITDLMSQNEEKNMSRNYVGIDGEGNFVSLLSLSSSIVIRGDLIDPEDNYPREMELPTIKIGRLVVDKRHRGKGYGKLTLRKAISLFIDISKKNGVIGLSVDAKTDSVNFYKKFGFKELKCKDGKEYTPMILYTNVLKRSRPSLFEKPV